MSRRNGRYQWMTAVCGLMLAGGWCCSQAAARQPGFPGSANQKGANQKAANQKSADQKVAGPNGGTTQPQGKGQELTPKQRAVKEQVAARMKLMLQKFDVNRNGRLEPEEEQAARAKLMEQGANRGGKLGSGPQVGAGGVQGGGAFGGGAFGGDQGAPVAADEDDRGAAKKKKTKDPNAKQKLLAEFDADGNGKLDPTERKAAHKAAAQRKAEAAKAGQP